MTKPEDCQTAAMTTRVDRHVAVLDPVEGEGLETPGLHRVLEADAGIEEPLPGGAGDDEGERHRIEVDRAQHALGADLLVEQDGEHQPEHGADDDVERAEDREIGERPPPVRQVPELDVVLQADPVRSRQDLRVGEGQIAGEQDEAVDEQQMRRRSSAPAPARQEVLHACDAASAADSLRARRRRAPVPSLQAAVKKARRRTPAGIRERHAVTSRRRPPPTSSFTAASESSSPLKCRVTTS